MQKNKKKELLFIMGTAIGDVVILLILTSGLFLSLTVLRKNQRDNGGGYDFRYFALKWGLTLMGVILLFFLMSFFDHSLMVRLGLRPEFNDNDIWVAENGTSGDWFARRLFSSFTFPAEFKVWIGLIGVSGIIVNVPSVLGTFLFSSVDGVDRSVDRGVDMVNSGNSALAEVNPGRVVDIADQF